MILFMLIYLIKLNVYFSFLVCKFVQKRKKVVGAEIR